MSRSIPVKELDLIEQVISIYRAGIGISALESVLSSRFSKILTRRTLTA
jgi:hypothetical protein